MIIVHSIVMRLCLGTVVMVLLTHQATASMLDEIGSSIPGGGIPDSGGTGAGQVLDNLEGLASTLHRAARRAPDRPESEVPPVPGHNDVLIRNRDPYIFNLFEVLLTTLETKLRRVENMDKALERLVHRLDTMEERLALNFNLTNQMMHMMEAQVYDAASINEPTSRRRGRHFGSTTEDGYGIHARITELSNHVSRIDNKINNIQVSLDSNVLGYQDELVAEASETYRINIPRVQVLDKNPSLSALQHTLDGVYESCSTIDRRLQYHMDIVSDNLEVLSHNVKDIHLAVIDTPSTGISASEEASFNNRTMEKPQNKIDLLVSRMDPFVTVWQKMEEVWGVVVGTKTSVDHLVPKSDALLSTSERQERAIAVIHTDLNEKANKIIKGLGQMEERLKIIPPNGKADREHINPISLIRHSHDEEDKPNEQAPPFDLLDQTFLTKFGNSDHSGSTTERPDGNLSHRSQVGPSGLVFPSVQKKPVLINGTFVLSDGDSQVKQGYSCSDLKLQGMKKSDTYYIKIRGTTYWFLKVYCDMQASGGGWTVIQRRDDYGEPRENFIRDWNAYKHGFGNSDEEFWLGNENIYMLTNTQDYVLRIELEDFDGNKRYAEYSTFKLHGENEMYKLEIGGYSGNAGDSLNDPWYGSNLSPFSTYNSDNDRSSLNCASMLKGGWWWRSCGRGLNGLYLTDPNDLTARQGIVWFRWRGWDYSLKKAVMMIRPKDYNTERYTSPDL